MCVIDSCGICFLVPGYIMLYNIMLQYLCCDCVQPTRDFSRQCSVDDWSVGPAADKRLESDGCCCCVEFLGSKKKKTFLLIMKLEHQL